MFCGTCHGNHFKDNCTASKGRLQEKQRKKFASVSKIFHSFLFIKLKLLACDLKPLILQVNFQQVSNTVVRVTEHLRTTQTRDAGARTRACPVKICDMEIPICNTAHFGYF